MSIKPWVAALYRIRQRTNPKKEYSNYKYYCGKGIKCLISKDEIKCLWFRDRGYLMKKPSIDRINSNENYTYNNCRFIEMSENIARSNRNRIGTKRVGSSSKFIGVYKIISHGKIRWLSRFYKNGKRINLGLFTNELDASRCYKKFIKKKTLYPSQ